MSDERFHVIWVTGGELGILMNESVDWELELSPSWRSWFRRLVLRYPKDPDEEWKRGVVLFRLVLEEWNSLLLCLEDFRNKVRLTRFSGKLNGFRRNCGVTNIKYRLI